MKWLRRLPAALLLAAGLPAHADEVGQSGEAQARCLMSASKAYNVPSGVLLILLQVEGGSLGRVSRNTNATVDIGPMQVNSTWVPKVAQHWRSDPASTLDALRDSFCANIEAGTWVLRQSLDEAHGNLWEGVGLYHSHDAGYKADYLRKVLMAALRLQAHAAQTGTSNVQVARN